MRRMLAVITAVALMLALALPVLGQVAPEGTCTDLGFAANEEASVSGEWGSITFDPTSPTLTLVVEEGFEVNLCVKAGSVNQGDGPEDLGSFGEGTYTLSHSSLKELSHFGYSFDELETTTTSSTTSSTTTTSTTSTTTTTTLPTTTTTTPVVTPFCVDVNTATQAELEELGGVNGVIALAIIAGRPYDTVQDLADVLPPGVLALILIVNAETGAFASDECLSSDGTTTTTTTTTIPGSTTTTVPGSTTTTPIQFGEVTAVCVSDIPFFAYDVNFEGATIVNEIRFLNPNGPDVVYTNQPLSGQVLWPGASDVPPFDWPGWELINGVWVETDDGFLWARETMSVQFTINPTATVQVDYPPASAICAGPENLNPNLPPAPTTTARTGVLPFTGTDTPIKPLSFLAGAIGLLGLALLVATRKGRIDSDE